MAESTVEGMLTTSGSQRPKRRARLNAKRKLTTSTEEDEIKRRRTFDTFYTFCNFVLEYEEKLASESLKAAGPPSPVNSAGESSASSTPSSSDTSSNGSDVSDAAEGDGDGMGVGSVSSATDESKLEYTSDDESWNLVTCFCRRPFAGRPMIECSKCKTWIHLFCARVKKDHVPDIYICPSCRPKAS